MAYQIKDDIDDIEEHKLPRHPSFRCSRLFAIAYEHGSGNEKQRLCACLKKGSEGDCCIDLISSKKTLEKAGQLYEHYKNRAIRSLSPLKNAPLKSFLRKVIQKICN
jgi:geranylgeranyl pyrophosphate synthase